MNFATAEVEGRFTPFMSRSKIPNVSIPLGQDDKPDSKKILKLINRAMSNKSAENRSRGSDSRQSNQKFGFR